jgi:hypothetical protein
MPDENIKYSRGRINVALCSDLLFVIYRYQPTTAMEAFPLRLALEHTDAFKLSVVDAFITIIVEVNPLTCGITRSRHWCALLVCANAAPEFQHLYPLSLTMQLRS